MKLDKTVHYVDEKGGDYIEHTVNRFGVQPAIFTNLWNANKYLTRFGKKDAQLKEATKIYDYVNRSLELYLKDGIAYNGEDKAIELILEFKDREVHETINKIEYQESRMSKEEFSGYVRGTLFDLNEGVMSFFTGGDKTPYANNTTRRLLIVKTLASKLVNLYKE